MANLAEIEKFLRAKNIPYKVTDLGGEIFTVEEVKAAGINEDEIVKTLIVRTNNGFVALALRGKDRIDFRKVRKLFGRKSELANADEVLKICGVPVGAVCPVLLKIPLYFDRQVMDLVHVNMGSGDLTKELEMDLEDLLKAVEKYMVEDFAKTS